MLIKKFRAYYPDKWWRPILFNLISFLLIILTGGLDVKLLEIAAVSLFRLSILGLVVSFIYQLSKRRWDPATFTFIFLAVVLGSIMALYASAIIIEG